MKPPKPVLAFLSAGTRHAGWVLGSRATAWPARFSFRALWPLYALIAILVAVLAAGGLFFVRALALEESAALADNDAIAQNVASLILAREDAYLKILQAYAGRFRFRQAIERQDRAEAMVHLRQLRETFPELDRPFLTTAAGVSWAVYPDAPEVYGRSFAHRHWYRGVSRAWQPYMSEMTEVAAADRALTVGLVVPVHDVDGTVIGILGSSQRLAVIRQWLLPIQVPAGDFYIVDRRGQLVFHRHRSLPSQARDYVGVPVVQRVLRGEAGRAELENPVEGELGLNAYRWLPTLGWGVVVHRSKNLALQRTRTLLMVAAGFTCALVGGIAVMGVVAVRSRQRLEVQANALGQAEGLARQASAQAEAANRAKSEFLSQMSHELRTPLNAIIGFAELMHDGKVGPVSAEQQEFLGDILISARHLLQLINDVLDLSKVESGRMEFHPESVDLAALVGEIRDVLRGVAVRKRIRLDMTVDPAIGPMVVDPAKLKQVLYNYLSNAVKFTPEDGSVSLRVAPEGADAVRIEVQDTGPGIDEEDLARLFVEFQQLDGGPGRQHEGTGLGLALTKRIVEAQGGQVGVRSTPGQGSVFFAILPRTAQRVI
jgi:signal transduction histidine kinase